MNSSEAPPTWQAYRYLRQKTLIRRIIVEGEHLYNALGKTESGRYLSIFQDMSIYDASDFWDEHDFGEFDDVQEVEDIKFSLKKKKYVGIDRDLYAIIKSKAKTLNESEDVLINEWLSEKAGV